jgi:hypothetical protein
MSKSQKDKIQLLSFRAKLRTFEKPEQSKCRSVLEYFLTFLTGEPETEVEGSMEEYPFDNGVKCILF